MLAAVDADGGPLGAELPVEVGILWLGSTDDDVVQEAVQNAATKYSNVLDRAWRRMASFLGLE